MEDQKKKIEKAVEKIKKLLALSKNNPNPV